MKRIFLIMIPVLLETACDKTVCPVSNDAEQVVFTCSLSQMKSSFREDFSQQWHPDDLVGIYGTVGGNGLVKNLPYLVNVCDEDPSKADFSPVSESLLWAGKGKYVFYAYSPYVMENVDFKAIPFTLPALQKLNSANDPSGLEEYDIIVAEAEIDKKDLTIGEKAEVSFSFRHVFSIVQLNVSADASMRGKSIHRVLLHSETHPLAGLVGKIDLSVRDRFIKSNAGSSCVVLDVAQPLVLSGNTDALYFMCLPTGENGCDLHVTVILEDGQIRTFDYKDVVLASNSRVVLNARLISGGIISDGVSFPVNMSMTSKSTQPIYAVVLGNTMYFANGARLERNDAPLKFMGRTYDSQVSSASWTESSAYVVTLPLAEMLHGQCQMDFTFMSRGLANWQVDWSSDSESWYRTSTFTLDNSSLAKECPVILDIPQNLAIPQGGNLYIRIKPKDLTPCQEGDVPYFDETSDPRIIGDISIRRL